MRGVMIFTVLKPSGLSRRRGDDKKW